MLFQVNGANAFDPQKALDAWKKAKPILLMDTGISGLLRALPTNPDQTKLSAYPVALMKLELAARDPKMQKEKQALACLNNIIKGIREYLDKTKEARADAIERVTTIHKAGQKFHAGVVAGPRTLELIETCSETWLTETRMARTGWDLDLQYAAAVPERQEFDVKESVKSMDYAFKEMERVLTTKVPNVDPKIEIPKELMRFKLAMDKLPIVCNMLRALKP